MGAPSRPDGHRAFVTEGTAPSSVSCGEVCFNGVTAGPRTLLTRAPVCAPIKQGMSNHHPRVALARAGAREDRRIAHGRGAWEERLAISWRDACGDTCPCCLVAVHAREAAAAPRQPADVPRDRFRAQRVCQRHTERLTVVANHLPRARGSGSVSARSTVSPSPCGHAAKFDFFAAARHKSCLARMGRIASSRSPRQTRSVRVGVGRRASCLPRLRARVSSAACSSSDRSSGVCRRAFDTHLRQPRRTQRNRVRVAMLRVLARLTTKHANARGSVAK